MHALHDIWLTIVQQYGFIRFLQELIFKCLVLLNDLLPVIEDGYKIATDLLLHLEPQELVEEVLDLNIVNMVLLVVLVKSVQALNEALLLFFVLLLVNFEHF